MQEHGERRQKRREKLERENRENPFALQCSLMYNDVGTALIVAHSIMCTFISRLAPAQE